MGDGLGLSFWAQVALPCWTCSYRGEGWLQCHSPVPSFSLLGLANCRHSTPGHSNLSSPCYYYRLGWPKSVAPEFVPLPFLTPNIAQETDTVLHSALAALTDCLNSHHILGIPLHENEGLTYSIVTTTCSIFYLPTPPVTQPSPSSHPPVEWFIDTCVCIFSPSFSLTHPFSRSFYQYPYFHCPAHHPCGCPS